MSRSDEFEAAHISARDIQAGDRLDISGKTRVSRTAVHNDKVLVAHKTRGARSGGVNTYKVTDSVKVWRKK
jgi:hypothetical protein